MALSAANILLSIRGDASDGEKTLADISRDLALFAREEAEAAAYIDTTEADVELDELKAKLEKFKAEDVSTEVNVKIAKAEADLAKLQAELDKVDHEDVNVDVDVKQGNVSRIASLSRDIEGLGEDIENTEKEGGSFSKFMSGAFSGAAENAGTVVKGLAVFLATGLVAALSAVVASLAEAVTGAAALADAFAFSLAPGIALAIGAIARFKEQSGEAGTASNKLKEAASSLFSTFKEATAGGADAVFRGLSDALGDLEPTVKALKPAFTALGQAGGDAFRALGKEFSSPAWQHFFEFFTESLTELTPLFARSFGALARILANIAAASMPYLISGFRQIAGWLEGIAKGTSGISELRGGIGGLVEQLKAWLHFAGALGEVFLGFIEAAAPQGKGFVEWLTKGAEQLAAWEKSKKGREEIHEFFKAVLPLAKETITAVAKLVVVFLKIEQLVAPVLSTLVHDFSAVLDVIGEVVSWAQEHFPHIRDLILGWISPIALVAKAFPAIKEAASDAWDFVKTKASDVWGFVTGLVEKPITFVLSFADDIPGLARSVWTHVKDAITNSIHFVIGFADDITSRARRIWDGVKNAIADAIHFVFSLPDDVASRARAIWDSVKDAVTDAISFVLSLPGDVVSRARGLWEAVKDAVTDAISFVLNVPHAVVGIAQGIWNEINEIMSEGIKLVIHVAADLSELPGKVANALNPFANGVQDLVRNQVAIVGERGPELAFLPKGTDIYTAGQTRNILRAMGRGASAPVGAATAGAGGSGGTVVNHNENVQIVSPGTGSPDPDIAIALWGQKLRARGLA